MRGNQIMPDYNKREKAEAKKMGAKLTKNSGRGMRKGDGTWRNFLVDWKFASKSFTLNKDVWAKVVTDTLMSDREKNPCLIIVFFVSLLLQDIPGTCMMNELCRLEKTVTVLLFFTVLWPSRALPKTLKQTVQKATDSCVLLNI